MSLIKNPPLLLSHYLPVVAWMAIIFVFSNQPVLPGSTIPLYDFIFKKSAHMFEYGFLYWLMWRATAKTAPKQPQLALWLPVVFTIAYAVSDEIHQGYVPGRTPALMDVGFDSLGTLIAFLRQYRYI